MISANKNANKQPIPVITAPFNAVKPTSPLPLSGINLITTCLNTKYIPSLLYCINDNNNATTPIATAGIKILLPTLSLAFFLNSGVDSTKLPILTCFKTVKHPIKTNSTPTPTDGIIFPNVKITPNKNQNNEVPIRASSFLVARYAVSKLTKPHKT